MTPISLNAPRTGRLRRLSADESGSVLVELALIMPIFLLLLFVLIDFGRLGYEHVMLAKGTDLATRIAVARPPACPGVAEVNVRGATSPLVTPPRFGTSCGSGANVCAAPSTVTCTGAMTNATAAEIWGRVDGLMPGNATVANLQFSYRYDANLGFLGGPYVPVVTVEVTDLEFQFVSPLGALATLAGGEGSEFPDAFSFRAMSTSLPAEDLAQGTSG